MNENDKTLNAIKQAIFETEGLQRFEVSYDGMAYGDASYKILSCIKRDFWRVTKVKLHEDEVQNLTSEIQTHRDFTDCDEAIDFYASLKTK